jgi:hypothetical protein
MCMCDACVCGWMACRCDMLVCRGVYAFDTLWGVPSSCVLWLSGISLAAIIHTVRHPYCEIHFPPGLICAEIRFEKEDGDSASEDVTTYVRAMFDTTLKMMAKGRYAFEFPPPVLQLSDAAQSALGILQLMRHEGSVETNCITDPANWMVLFLVTFRILIFCERGVRLQ